MFRQRPPSHSNRPQYNPNKGLPAWLIFLLGVAFVFGMYYLWLGVSDFIASGGLGVVEATERVVEFNTATAERAQEEMSQITLRPTFTPMPECQQFTVIVPSAIVREQASTSSAIVETFSQGDDVCVLSRIGDWYVVDRNPRTRRIEQAYMFHNIIEATNPTPTPTETFTPAPSVTPMPSVTRTPSPVPLPTITPDPNATATNTPTSPPPPTAPVQGA